MPHTLARICGALGDLLDDPKLLGAAQHGSASQQFTALIEVLRERPMLLVLDEVEQIVPHEAALLLELLHAIPCPSSALVTARGYHEIGFPTRVTWLTDDEMDNFIARACDDTRARLTRAQQRLVRAWAHGLPFAARVAMCRIQHVDVIRALEDFSRGPAPLVRPVIGQALSSLRREHADSYCGLQRLAEQDIERGMARLDALNLLDPEDPDAAMKELLDPCSRRISS